MSELQLEISIGDISVKLQGEGTLVVKILNELREQGLGLLKSEPLTSVNTTNKKQRISKSPKNNISSSTHTISKKKGKGNFKQPKLINDLDLNGKKGGKSLKQYFEEKKPSSNLEITTVFIYYLQNILKITNITLDYVFTCYRAMRIKIPKNLQQNLTDATSSKYGYTIVNEGTYTLSTIGLNLVEHDLPRKKNK